MAGEMAASNLFSEWMATSAEILSAQNNSNSLRRENASKFQNLTKISHSVFDMIDSGLSSPKMLDDMCQQIVALFRSKVRALCHLVLEFIPTLIWSYLSSVLSSKSKAGLEACLLTLYNLNLSSEKTKTHITIPSLGKNSVYHEIGSISSLTLTETALSKYESGDRKLPIGPFPQIEKLNAKNRLPVLSHLIRCFTKEIGLLSGRSHQSLCSLSIKVCCTGFKTYLSHRLLPHSSHATEHNLISRPRIVLSPEFLCEILHGIYFVMFNGQPEHGLEVLECIHQRANYELYSNVILLTNAIKNSLEHNPSGQPYDGPMGVSIAITPAHILSSLNKQAITNASFRAQKLPDDITPEDGEESRSDTEGETKHALTAPGDKQGKLLGGIKLSTRPLMSAFKRVERSITQKKNAEGKDTNPSPAKTDKTDGLHRTPRLSGKEKGAPGNGIEMLHVERAGNDMENGTHDQLDSFHSVVNHERIEIIIEPPAEDVEVTKM